MPPDVIRGIDLLADGIDKLPLPPDGRGSLFGSLLCLGEYIGQATIHFVPPAPEPVRTSVPEPEPVPEMVQEPVAEMTPPEVPDVPPSDGGPGTATEPPAIPPEEPAPLAPTATESPENAPTDAGATAPA